MNRNRKLIEFWTKYRVPFVYDDTMSLLQLVMKVIKHLNLMIEDQNELKDIIKEFIQAFDEDLQETVEEILVQWQGDGKLEEIINQALFESKLDKEEFEDFKKVISDKIDKKPSFNDLNKKLDKKDFYNRIGKIECYAHRGASLIAQENGLHAFNLAGVIGFDGIEFDVQPCASGEWVVIHDDTIDRTTNGKGSVSKMSFEELRKYNLWNSKNFLRNRNEKIPLLEEVLELAIRFNLNMLIEIKFKQSKEDIENLMKTIDSFGLRNNVVVMSFERSNIEHLKDYEIKTGLVVGRMTKADIDYMYNNFTYPLITFQYDVNNSDLFDYAKQKGVKIGPYTINGRNYLNRYERKDFDFITGGIIL